MEQLAKRIYEGEEITSDRQLLRSTAQDLLKGVQKGYGKREIDWNSPDADMIQNLTENVYQFAAAKNYHELRDMTDAVHDGDKVRSFDEFEKEVKDITGKYNRSWLRSEYNQAIAASQSAARWGDYQRNAKDMPFLQYQCVMDDNTRPEHASLHGIIKRIDDPFWDEFMPPNGWGCRCEVIQLPGSSYEETPDKDIHPAGVPDMFRTNFGKKGIVFPPGHAYYKRFPKEYEQQAKTMARAEVRRILNNAEQYEALKADPKYKDVAFDYTNGGLKATHVGHIEHSGNKVERFFGNLTSSQLELECQETLVKAGCKAILRDESIKGADGNYLPSLDLDLEGTIMDIRSITTPGYFGSALLAKNKQLGRVLSKCGIESHSVCLYFHEPSFFSEEKMKNAIDYYMRTCREENISQRIQEVYCVQNGSRYIYQYLL